MEAIAQGFQWIIETAQQGWEFTMQMLNGLILAFRSIFVIRDLTMTTLLNLPSWLQAFGYLTVAICVVYIVIGREAGKNK